MLRFKKIKSFLVFVCLLILISIPISAGQLQLHFIDVGQGDAILIQTADQNMLIDAGDRFSSVERKMVSYLKAQGVEKVDVIVGTHPHSDHIGGIPAIINNFEVGKIYDSGRVHTSATYENYLLLIDEKDIPFFVPRTGDEIKLGNLTFTVVHPDGGNIESYSLNNASIVLHLEYGEISFLFAGDIETEIENKLLNSGVSIEADIFKVSHHGSKSSSHEKFIDEVNPELAVIQVGEDNRYDHPSKEVLQTFKVKGIKTYRNDLHGDIVVITDGSNYSIQTSKDLSKNASPIIIKENESDKININTATASQLQQLDGIGPVISERIIRYRKEVGLFDKIEDIKKVSGIGEAKFDNIKDKITVW